jgi:glucose-6-phosphate isomerase
MNAGFDTRSITDPVARSYGPGLFGSEPEPRLLDTIRPGLWDPGCSVPEVVYSTVLDVGMEKHCSDLLQRHLLVGPFAYATGCGNHGSDARTG